MIRAEKNLSLLLKAGRTALGITFFLMPFPRAWCLYPLALFLISGLLVLSLGFKSYIAGFNRYRVSLIPFVIYFFLQLGSALRGPVIDPEVIEQKLMFILVPVFGLPVFLSIDNEEKRSFQFMSFLAGIILVFCFLLARAVMTSINPGDLDVNHALNPTERSSPFHYEIFSFFAHPTFLGIKVLFGLLIIVHFYRFNRGNRLLKYLMALLMLVFMILLSSKTVFIAATAYLIFYIPGVLKRSHLSGKAMAVLITGIIALLVLFGMNYRIREFLKPVWDPNDGINIREAVSSVPRYRQWSSACQLIEENWIAGVGLSNSRNELKERYLENGFLGEYELGLDAHNQFLEEMIANGIPGIVILLWMMYGPFLLRNNLRNKVLAKAFIVVFTVSALFESMFNRQWGIMFFMLFYCMILFTPQEVENDEPLKKVSDNAQS